MQPTAIISLAYISGGGTSLGCTINRRPSVHNWLVCTLKNPVHPLRRVGGYPGVLVHSAPIVVDRRKYASWQLIGHDVTLGGEESCRMSWSTPVPISA